MSNQSIKIPGIPSARQKEFFSSRTRFTAYGGARGGGKSWALRRKLVAMCLRYVGISCLLIRRTLPELKSNHVIPFLREFCVFLFTKWHINQICLHFIASIYSLTYFSPTCSRRFSLHIKTRFFSISTSCSSIF